MPPFARRAKRSSRLAEATAAHKAEPTLADVGLAAVAHEAEPLLADAGWSAAVAQEVDPLLSDVRSCLHTSQIRALPPSTCRTRHSSRLAALAQESGPLLALGLAAVAREAELEPLPERNACRRGRAFACRCRPACNLP